MENRDKRISALRELLARSKDPNEVIEAVRTMMAEGAEMPKDELFPMSDEPASDAVEGFIGIWLTLRATLPITSKEQVVESMNDLIRLIRMLQDLLPSDLAKLEVNVLRCLRKGSGPSPW